MNCLSVTFKTVPVLIRERFAISKENRKVLLEQLLSLDSMTECVILSTCNRTEFYFDGDSMAVYEVQKCLAMQTGMSLQEIMQCTFCYEGDRAIYHLYKVAAGMDSMVIGEDEILGQLKEAFFYSRDNKATSYYLNTIFQGAITCAKRIKTDTNLSKIPISIGTLVAREVVAFQPEGDIKILLIGITGKMGNIVCKHLMENPNVSIIGTVRNHEVQKRYDGEGIVAINYNDRYSVIDEADVIISVTTSPHYTITADRLRQSIVKKKKRLFLDLSVPMDMDREISQLEGVVRRDIDYFMQLSKENNESKKKELMQAQELLEEYISDVKKTMSFHTLIPHLPRLKEQINGDSFERMLYQLRDECSSEAFESIVTVLKRI